MAETEAKAPARPMGATAAKKVSRRSALIEVPLGMVRWLFGSWFAAAWTSFTVACTAAVLSCVRFLYPNVLREPPATFKIGPPDAFEEGVVRTDWTDKYGVWIVRYRNRIFALRSVCTHLGCTPSWLASEFKFKCPCHGSGFRIDGINFEGPAPRPLERYAVRIADDGQILVDKSRILRQDLGQWTEQNGAWVSVV
jgi:cytochrome b6-f complex iron-sulfur subunit